MLKLRPSALVSSRTAVDLPCEIETTLPWDSSSCMVRISIVLLLLLRPVSVGSPERLSPVPGETGARREQQVARMPSAFSYQAEAEAHARHRRDLRPSTPDRLGQPGRGPDPEARVHASTHGPASAHPSLHPKAHDRPIEAGG